MSDILKESLADIEALAHRVSWELMDESQRDEFMTKVVVPRWGKTTSDGHALKATAWARMVGATVDAIDGRYRRLRRPEGVGDPSSSPTPNQRASVRSAKSAIRQHPEMIKDLEDEIAKDPATVARIIQKAEELRPTPKPVVRAHPLVAVSDLGAAEAKYRKALTGIEEVVRDGRLHPSELEESVREVDRWKTRLSILQGWSGDMDEQLENLMNGGSNA